MNPGKIIIMVRIGTSGDEIRGFAPRWVNDPVGTYQAEEERGRAWCADNDLPFQHCAYHPAGALPSGVQGVMQFNQFPLLCEQNAKMARAIAREFRRIADSAENGEEHSVYLGAIYIYPWRTRFDVAKCVRPYMLAGKSSLIIDALGNWPRSMMNETCLGELQMAFADVYGEGGLGPEDDWMLDRGAGIVHLADVHASIYANRPDKYLPLRPGVDRVMVSNAPGVTQEARHQQKLVWTSQWLQAGVDVIIESGELSNITYAELIGS